MRSSRPRERESARGEPESLPDRRFFISHVPTLAGRVARAFWFQTHSYRFAGKIAPKPPAFSAGEPGAAFIAPYRLIYRISGHLVLVLGVFDSRRNLEDILLERLSR